MGTSFQNYVMSPSTQQESHLNSSPKALAPNYQTAKHHIPEDYDLEFPRKHTSSFKTKGILPPTLRHIC